MKSKLISAIALAVASLTSHGAQAAGVDGDPVLYWNQLLIQSLPASPLFSARHAAIFNTAVHDAVNAAQGGPNHGYLGPTNPNGGDTRAATAAAAYTVLKSLYGDKPAYQAAYAQSLALVSDVAARNAGVASGEAYAAQILTQRANDGWNVVVPYTPSGLIGRWAPTPPPNLAAAAPQWGDVTPFVITSGSQFRPGAPPALDSATYAAAYAEVYAIGGQGSALRTADQSAAANYWVGASGPGPWLQVALNRAETEGSSVMDNATLLARLSTAIMDASIGIFDAKYEYDYWRPVTAIRNGNADGNPATVADATWLPYITTPNHPSYISGHSGIAAAGSTILASAFGDTQSFCLTWASQNRCWANYTQSAEDAAMSRLWGGIHWRFDNEAGLALGRQVAAFTLDARAFGAVPEPGVWGLLIVGFGVVGAGLRRKRPCRNTPLYAEIR